MSSEAPTKKVLPKKPPPPVSRAMTMQSKPKPPRPPPPVTSQMSMSLKGHSERDSSTSRRSSSTESANSLKRLNQYGLLSTIF